MEASMLEETVQNPNPYPVVAELHYDDIWQLCVQARELAWDAASDIDWTALAEETAGLPENVRQAGAEWWSLRAWMEHGATPYGAERLRQAIFEHLPFEVKQHVANFTMEELRHHEASFRIADALGGYQPTPRSDYFQMIIPKFHDERDEKVMSFYAGMAVNTLFEQLSGELLTARYKNARYPQIKLACQLILRDEARHIQFGRIIMRRFFEELSKDDKRLLGEKFAKKLRGSLLNGVYSVVNLPRDERKRSANARALAAEHGLGATHPDEEVGIIAEALATIRKDVAPYDVPIPEIAEVEGDAIKSTLAAE
ncbi:MAG: diiron oxygenase [Alphaproteobacteria bacterium]|nr:diiron oxygenase [Alphaproteobacteria bacterium]